MTQPTSQSVFEQVARDHIETRLTQAADLLRGGLGRNIRRVRDLLAEAADQADAYEMLRQPDGPAADDAAHRQTAHTLRARDLSEPVTEFLLIPFGKVEVERPLAGDDFEFREEHAVAAVNWFASLGRKLAIDYEHQSFERHNTRPDGLRPAAGWIAGLEMRRDGLWAVGVTWTQRARELLRTGEYRYFSPVIFWADETASRLVALGPVALTNDPAMRGIQALAASRTHAARHDAASSPPGETTADHAFNMDARDSREAAPLTPPAGASHPEPTFDEPAADAVALLARAEAAENEVDLLRRQILGRDADLFVERGLREGRIVDSTSMDWRDDFIRDPQGAEQRLARSPVLRMPGRLVPAASALRAGDRSPAVATALRDIGAEAEDLKAYEVATAAGRVRTAR